MKKSHQKAFAAVFVGAVLATATPAMANAANLYEHNSYVGYMWSGTSSPGGLPVGYNDKTSSVGSSVAQVYCENWNCGGRKVSLNGSFSNLSLISYNLSAFENWNDRISALE
jgi:hypothetical protein